jgi:hypothetical protein
MLDPSSSEEESETETNEDENSDGHSLHNSAEQRSLSASGDNLSVTGAIHLITNTYNCSRFFLSSSSLSNFSVSSSFSLSLISEGLGLDGRMLLDL